MQHELKTHQLADLLPMMNEKEFQALKADIKDVGLQEPVILFEDKILDGRNRYRACRELGTEIKTRPFEGKQEDALNYVVSANLQRRQLKASQRAAIGVRLLPLVREEVHKSRLEKLREAAKRRTDKALWEEGSGEVRANLPTPEERGQIRVRKIVADMLGIADRLISDAQFLGKKDPGKLKQVEQGSLRLHAAVAPFRQSEARRRTRKADPLKKAARLLRHAERMLAEKHANLSKQAGALAARIEGEKPAVVASAPPRARKRGK